MNLYLDDDSTNPHLVRLLQRDNHDVMIPGDMGMRGHKDPAHLMAAITLGRILVTHNHDDFHLLHDLVLLVGGHHPGVLVVRRDNDPSRDMSPKRIVRAIRNLERGGVVIVDQLHVLNHWR